VLVLGPSDPLLHDPRLWLDSTRGFLVYRRLPIEVTDLSTHPSTKRDGSGSWERARAEPLREEPSPALASPSLAAGTLGERTARGRALADRGELASALAVLADAGDDPDALVLRALVAQELGDHAGALRDAQALTALDSPPVLALVIEAMALVKSGELERARDAIARARETLSGSAPGTELGQGVSVADLISTLQSLETRTAPPRRRKERSR
jgi:hypothetical protein